MDHLRCVVERITYQNPENGYTVLKCKAKGFDDLITVVGSMPEVHVGSVITMTGNWKVDAKYGRQFSMESYEEMLPATVYGIEKYLGSGLIKGVGPKFASRIVKEFGADTLTVIEENPDSLIKVPGIGRIRVEKIKKSWQDQKEIKNIMLFLQSHDVSTSHATKIFKTYSNDSISVVQENPYRLADDIWGIGFKTADTIAEKMGFGHEKYERLRSGLLYTLNKLSEDGRCYATREMLLKTSVELLSVEEPLLSASLDSIIEVEDVKTELLPSPPAEESDTATASEDPAPSDPGKAIYLPPFWFSEVGCARRLAAIASAPCQQKPVDRDRLENWIRQKTGIDYDDFQIQAIVTALENKVTILTGGPSRERISCPVDLHCIAGLVLDTHCSFGNSRPSTVFLAELRVHVRRLPAGITLFTVLLMEDRQIYARPCQFNVDVRAIRFFVDDAPRSLIGEKKVFDSSLLYGFHSLSCSEQSGLDWEQDTTS